MLILGIFTQVNHPQVDSLKYDDKLFYFNPDIHSIQIDATSIVIMNQIGGEFDFDIFQLKNKNSCLGTRIGIEHYYLINFADKYYGSPFTNYNIFARMSGVTNDLSMSILVGITYYTSAENYFPSTYLFRTGFEIKYGTTFGFLLKGSTSLKRNTSFIGVGIFIGYNHN